MEEDPSKLHDIVIRPLNPSGNVNGAVGNLFVTTPSKNGESKDFSKAKFEDKVLVRVVPADGMQLKEGSLVFVYTSDGKKVIKKIVTFENRGNNVYAFYMPDFDVSIEATFEPVPAGTVTAPAKTGNGKTIGVGASFALDVINVTVEAGIGSSRKVTGKSIEVKAGASMIVQPHLYPVQIRSVVTKPMIRRQRMFQ